MKIARLVLLLPLFSVCALALPHPGPAKPALASPQTRAVNSSSAKPVLVYVSDFELAVLQGRAVKNASSRNSPRSTSGSASSGRPTAQRTTSSGPSSNTSAFARTTDSETDETPAGRANALVNAMSENLMKVLEKAGYMVRRLRAGEARPAAGLQIRGVFGEVDERNRVRRLLVGSDPITANMLLFVGVSNLARPEQPLYELANPPSNDDRHGPVITVTSYAPVARFEMDREPADEDLKKIASQITADLTALLNANPTAAP